MQLPDIPKLGQWLHSWVQPDGAIYGFHNHSVWGGNPYRFLDMTAGHSTFASPLIPALALALQEHPHSQGQSLVESLIEFQAGTFQPDDQFEHIGFQVGEILKSGLIHNVVPDVALTLAASILKETLDPTLLETVDLAVRRNLKACDQLHGDRPFMGKEGKGGSCCNQDYCRIWARLLHMEAFDHREWDERVRESLHFMIEHFHISGVPDRDSSGALRSAGELRFLEPAEYYGLMIHPLLLGYERYGEVRFLSEAKQLARHIVRGSWKDGMGHQRFHRMYQQDGGEWIRVREPMLIGGMGITLSSMQRLVSLEPEVELEDFLKAMDSTYAHYQSPGGFFLGATGWNKECDIIPSSAWQSHDLFHLVSRHGVGASFWEQFFTPSASPQIVLGTNCFWMEANAHWALYGYFTMEDADLIGRKDESRFYREYASWIRGANHAPEHFQPGNRPVFQKIDDAILHFEGREDLSLFNATSLAYRGPSQALHQPFQK